MSMREPGTFHFLSHGVWGVPINRAIDQLREHLLGLPSVPGARNLKEQVDKIRKRCHFL